MDFNYMNANHQKGSPLPPSTPSWYRCMESTSPSISSSQTNLTSWLTTASMALSPARSGIQVARHSLSRSAFLPDPKFFRRHSIWCRILNMPCSSKLQKPAHDSQSATGDAAISSSMFFSFTKVTSHNCRKCDNGERDSSVLADLVIRLKIWWLELKWSSL